MKLDINQQSVSDKFSQLMSETSQNVHGFSLAFKTKNGKPTEDLSVVYYVHQKRPLQALGEHEMIPNFIEIDGQILKTDVVQMPATQLVTNCFNWTGTTPESPIPDHRAFRRPLIGGINISTIFSDGIRSGATPDGSIYNFRNGTLGAIVVDETSNTLVGLTNSHVAIQEYLYAHERTGDPYNIYDDISAKSFNPSGSYFIYTGSKTTQKFEQLILQGNTNAEITISGANIGRPKRYAASAPSFPGCNVSNKVDGALITLNSSDLLVNGTSNLQLNILNGVTNLPFATTAEINACIGLPAAASGATTGPKDEACGLIIKSVNTFASISIQGKDVYYSDLILFDYADEIGAAAWGGDSGSTLSAKINNEWKIVGLVFAGTPNLQTLRSHGYACRIDNVCNQLNIRSWDGSQMPVDGPARGEIKVVDPSFKADFFVENGETYFQAGLGTAQLTTPTGEFSCVINRFVCPSSTGDGCDGYEPGLGLTDYTVEAIYVHSAGDPTYAICSVVDSRPTSGIYLDTDHSSVVYLGEDPFYSKIQLPSGVLAPSGGISFDINYSSQFTGFQLLAFDTFPPTGGITRNSSLTGTIPSGSGIYEFFIVPAIDNPGIKDLNDAEGATVTVKNLTYPSNRYTGNFMIVESGYATGSGINPLGATRHPCGGGHSCNRADFDILIDTPLVSGHKVLDAKLNNAGTNDNGPGPFPFNGPMDRYSSAKISEEDNTKLFGSGINGTGLDPSTPVTYKVRISPASGNTNAHVGITWVRILNPCNQPIYSCCLSVGGGTSAPPNWTPPYVINTQTDFLDYL